jgi:TolA-binding protein
MARAYLSYPKEALARALLQTIVKDYPDTPAAAEARKELAKLK